MKTDYPSHKLPPAPADLFAQRPVFRNALFTRFAAYLFFLFITSLLSPQVAFAQVRTFTVNTTDDRSDPDAGELGDDGHCDVDPLTPGDQCPLRAAIQNHNGNRHLGTNEIKFNIPNAPGTGSILLLVGSLTNGPLPTVLGSVIMKGRNEPDGRRIELDGSMAGGGAIGLVLRGGHCVISDFIINNFSSHGILISGTPPPGGGGHRLTGNYIGTDATGRSAKPNGGDGIFIENTPANMIGGTADGDRNVISGNKGYGINIRGADPAVDFASNAARDNCVMGNRIGTDIDGSAVLPNEAGGINGDNAPATRIGDSTDKKAANTLGGVKNGITIHGNLSEGFRIEGNYFTEGAGGKFAAGIFGRGGKQLYITGNLMLATTEVDIDLFFDGDGGYNIRKNRFEGKTRTGLKARFGEGREIMVDYSHNFHKGAGLALDVEESINGKADWTFFGNEIRDGDAGAKLMFRATGVKDFTKNLWDVKGQSDLSWTIDAGEGASITLKEIASLHANSNGPSIVGSIEGRGEVFLEMLNNTVNNAKKEGGILGIFADAGLRGNITLAGNEWTLCAGGGLRAISDGKSYDLKFIYERNLHDRDNFFGLSLDNIPLLRRSVIGNTFTNIAGPAIVLNGTTEAHLANNTIRQNEIGVLVNEPAVGELDNNIITRNGKGVVLTGSGTGTLLTTNAIYQNTGLGIDLGNDGVTANDNLDSDAGPNGLQNFPVLNTAVLNGPFATIQGTVNSVPNSVLRIEFFGNSGCHPSGFGEGEKYLGFTTVTTNSSGNAGFAETLAMPAGLTTVAATATDPQQNTSEFSRCLSLNNTSLTGADLSLLKTADKATAISGDKIVFRLAVTNRGPQPTTRIMIRDFVPLGMVFAAAAPSSGTYNRIIGYWSIPALDNGSTAVLQLEAFAVKTGVYANQAAIISSTTADPSNSNNQATVLTTIQPTNKLEVLYQNLVLLVNDILAKGRLVPGDAQALLSFVEDSRQHAAAHRYGEAITGLETATALVRLRVSAGVITPYYGGLLTDAADLILVQLRRLATAPAAPTPLSPANHSIKAAEDKSPEHQSLLAYPNPFTSGLNIRVSQTAEDRIRLAVYDVTGRLVAFVANQRLGAGDHTFRWQPSFATAAVYLVVLTGSNSRKTQWVTANGNAKQ